MADLDKTARDFIREIKAALQKVQRSLDSEALSIKKLELELKTTVTKIVGGGFSIKIIDLEAHHQREDEQTLTIALVPAADGVDLMAGVSEELTEAILAIAVAAKEAADTEPKFALDEATISIAVGMTNDGKVKVFVEGSGSRENTHTATLTLKRQGQAG